MRSGLDEVRESEDAVTGLNGTDAVTHGFDHSGAVPAEGDGEGPGGLNVAERDLPVGRIHAAGMIADQDLSGAHFNVRKGVQMNVIEVTVFMEAQGLHEALDARARELGAVFLRRESIVHLPNRQEAQHAYFVDHFNRSPSERTAV